MCFINTINLNKLKLEVKCGKTLILSQVADVVFHYKHFVLNKHA